MNTAFDSELTDTLRELADEVGPGSANLAAVALRDGRRIRGRRTVVTALASIVTLAVLAAPAVIVSALHHDRSAAAAGVHRMEVIVAQIPAGNRTELETTLSKRFTDAGFTVTGSRLYVRNEVEFFITSRLPWDTMQAQVQQLVAPGWLEFRAVVDSYPQPSLTHSQRLVGGHTTAKPPTLAQVKSKLGAAYTFAASLTGPAKVSASTKHRLAPFATLAPAEVAVLPAKMQFDIPTISCAQLAPGPSAPRSEPALAQQLVTCDSGGAGAAQFKYLLDAAKLTNADVATATSVHDGTIGRVVNLTFTGAGQTRWTNWTKQLFGGADPSNSVYRQVAILVDNTVVTAPNIEAAISGPATISGAYTESSARALAAVLDDGPLPGQTSVMVLIGMTR